MCVAVAQTSQSSQRKTSTLSEQRAGGKLHSSVSTARTAAAAADSSQVSHRTPCFTSSLCQLLL